MKRIVALTISVIIALTAITGCAFKKQLTAFGLYTKAVNTIREAGGMEAECKAVLDLSLIKVGIDMNIKQNGSDSEVTVIMSGEQVSKTITVGDMVYTDAAGVKTRSPKAAPADDSIGDISALPKLAEDLFTDIEIVEDENGGKALTIVIGSDTIAALLGEGAEIIDGIDFDDCEMTMYFDADDNIKSMHLESDAAMDFSEFEMKISLTVDYDFINLGTAPEISIPEDADDYTLINLTDNT